MSKYIARENIPQPSNLQEALNTIKFLTTSHKREIFTLRQINKKQADIIAKLQSNRKMELDFLSSELQKYEMNLHLRTQTVTSQLASKDDIIQRQTEVIEELHKKLKLYKDKNIPKIKIFAVDSNSDSGIALDNENSSTKVQETRMEIKVSKKSTKRLADSISFLRKVDFSSMRYKNSNRGSKKKKEEKKSVLGVPSDLHHSFLSHKISNDLSDDNRSCSPDSDEIIEQIMIRTKPMNDSMNNNFSNDGSEDTSEELNDRVMTKCSIKSSFKSDTKYKKISRCKSKHLEQVKLNIGDQLI